MSKSSRHLVHRFVEPVCRSTDPALFEFPYVFFSIRLNVSSYFHVGGDGEGVPDFGISN